MRKQAKEPRTRFHSSGSMPTTTSSILQLCSVNTTKPSPRPAAMRALNFSTTFRATAIFFDFIPADGDRLRTYSLLRSIARPPDALNPRLGRCLKRVKIRPTWPAPEDVPPRRVLHRFLTQPSMQRGWLAAFQFDA